LHHFNNILCLSLLIRVSNNPKINKKSLEIKFSKNILWLSGHNIDEYEQTYLKNSRNIVLFLFRAYNMLNRFFKDRLKLLKIVKIIILQDSNIRDGIDKINDYKIRI
jgi:hypothetical protein